VAATLAPDDPEIEKKAAEAQKLAAVVLADGYFKQAEYEASQGRWEEAALSYGKVCEGRPNDPLAHDRAAVAVLKGSGNTRLAVELARHAVSLAPSVPQYHLTLARAYLAAGFARSAEGEIQRAIELAPNDAKIRALAAEVRRGTQDGSKVG
jgi:tetratricopeptide (TPR) repeat protein